MTTSTVPRTTWLALAVLLSGVFMALLDTTIVYVAIPTIREDLDASGATLSWIICGYALAFGLMLIPASRVGDRFGHKWIFIAGAIIFTLGSLACGLSLNSQQLIAARVLQGLGGGIFSTAITALIQLMFAPPVRGRAFAAQGAVIGLATALGPLVGGLIIQFMGEENGWRWIFGVNVPIGIAVIIAAFRLLPGGAQSTVLAVDPVGLVLLASGLIALLAPLTLGQDEGWPTWTYRSLIGSGLLLSLFGLWELRLSRNDGMPLVPPRLFRSTSFAGGSLLALVSFGAFTSVFFTLSLLWQSGLHHSALQSGLLITPFGVGSILGASQSDKLANRYGRTVLNAGLGLVLGGMTAVLVIVLELHPLELNRWYSLPPLFVSGVGSGLFIAPNTRFIVATVPRADAGAASGVLRTMQRIGSAIGIVIIGSVFFGSLQFSEGPNADATAFAYSASRAMEVSVLFCLAAFLLSFLLPRHPPPGSDGPPADAG